MDYARILGIMEAEGRKRDAAIFTNEWAILSTPFRGLIFTILSARSKDERTMQVCKELFSRADTPKKLLSLGEEELERILRPIGFYKVKSSYLRKTCEKLLSNFNGEVPGAMEELLTLPGVGRKTANIVLEKVFGHKTIAVDVHVHRISNRLGWVKTKNPLDTEKKLLKIVPDGSIARVNHAMVAYGQTVCLPRNPKCDECRIRKYCKRVGLPPIDGMSREEYSEYLKAEKAYKKGEHKKWKTAEELLKEEH
jgi:endonuclease-3